MKKLIKLSLFFVFPLFGFGQELLILEFKSLNPEQTKSNANWVKFDVCVGEEMRLRIFEDKMFRLCFEECIVSVIAYSFYPTGSYPPLDPKVTFEKGDNDDKLVLCIDYGRLKEERKKEWLRILYDSGFFQKN